jgi:hypothetical protein
MDATTRPALSDPALARKLQRLATGARPRVLDLFSGAGGISLGFHRAGFQIEGALEIEPLPALTHALNFHADEPESTLLHAQPRDMTRVEPDQLADELRLGSVESAIDVLVGGPPCQAYARVGRAKLREVADHPEAYKVDPRGNLFLRYLAYVKAFRPLAVLMENVPDIMHYGGHNVIEEMVEALDGFVMSLTITTVTLLLCSYGSLHFELNNGSLPSGPVVKDWVDGLNDDLTFEQRPCKILDIDSRELVSIA